VSVMTLFRHATSMNSLSHCSDIAIVPMSQDGKPGLNQEQQMAQA